MVSARTVNQRMLASFAFETGDLDASSRDFLEDAIQDYNDMFGTSFDTSGDKFQNYYKDLSLRLKNRELEMPRRPREIEGGAGEGAARIEIADLKERIRKLEAIASGEDL